MENVTEEFKKGIADDASEEKSEQAIQRALQNMELCDDSLKELSYGLGSPEEEAEYTTRAMTRSVRKFTNSPLVDYTCISPNCNVPRQHDIDTITIHMVVGQCSVETLGNVFLPWSRQASSNYGVGFDGRIGMYCYEGNRSWCSSSPANDHRAVTIETASDTYYPYAVNAKAYSALIKLCADICKRNGKTKMVWCGSLAKTNARKFASNEMRMTLHKWFAATECPGFFLESRMQDIADKTNEILSGKPKPKPKPVELPTPPFAARVNIQNLTMRKKPTKNSEAIGYAQDAVYRVYKTKEKWGKIGKGKWIYLGNSEWATCFALPCHAVVKVDDLNIRSSATSTSASKGYAKKGVEYKIKKVKKDWGYIPKTGWIYISNPSWVTLKK